MPFLFINNQKIESKMFQLICEIEQATTVRTEIESTLNEMLDLYQAILTESVETLADKFQNWLQNRNITAEELGFMIGGIALLVSDEGRTAISREDLINMDLQGDLKRAEKIDNVDLNSMIRRQIIHLGKNKAPKLSSMITQAVRDDQLNQIRNFILKLSLYVDRIKSSEKYEKQPPHVVKNSRRVAPHIPQAPTNG